MTMAFKIIGIAILAVAVFGALLTMAMVVTALYLMSEHGCNEDDPDVINAPRGNHNELSRGNRTRNTNN